MAIELIETIDKMRIWTQKKQAAGQTIALVPTMGALHEGHLSLIRKAKEMADNVVVSIFVNPTQFAPNEDFAQYPRNLSEDSRKAASAGATSIFHPAPEEMYPSGYLTYVTVEKPAAGQSPRF